MHIDNIYKTIQFCQLWMLWTSQDTTNSPALKAQVPSPSVWAPGAALAALQAQLVPRTVWSRLLQRAQAPLPSSSCRCVGGDSGRRRQWGPPGCLCLWQASSLLGRASRTARDRRDVFVKSDPSESVGRRPRYFVSGGHTWSPHQLSARGKTAMSVTRLVLKRGSAAVTACNISDEKRLSMWPFLILL